MMLQVGGAFLLALMGTPHCVAMCGPIALANARPRQGCGSGQLGLVHAARGLGYVSLGLLAGSAVPLVARLGGDAQIRGGARLACGAVLLVVGLLSSGLVARVLARVRVRSATPTAAATTTCAPTRVTDRTGSSFARAGALGRGLLWALLPCGLIYAGLGLALSVGSTLGGGLVMAAFFVGTLPSMTFVIAALRTLEGRMSLHRVRLATGLIVALGGLLQVEAAVETLRGSRAEPVSEEGPAPPPRCH